jgi:hypothetical protein
MAIVEAHYGTQLIVDTTTFYDCRTTGPSWGGAITKVNAGTLTVSEFCFRECSTENVGFAIDVGTHDDFELTLCSILSCGYTGSEDTGVSGPIHEELIMHSTYRNLNLSSTTLIQASTNTAGIGQGGGGTGRTSGDMMISYSTFMKCEGGYVVMDYQPHTDYSVISHSNFFSHTVSNAILGATDYGFQLTGCVISATANSICDVPGGKTKYTFTDCVFSAGLPDTSTSTFSGSNVENQGLTSRFLTFLPTEWCPTESATRSASHSPEKTAYASPTDRFTCSPFFRWRVGFVSFGMFALPLFLG